MLSEGLCLIKAKRSSEPFDEYFFSGYIKHSSQHYCRIYDLNSLTDPLPYQKDEMLDLISNRDCYLVKNINEYETLVIDPTVSSDKYIFFDVKIESAEPLTLFNRFLKKNPDAN